MALDLERALREAEKESEQKSASHSWIAERLAQIHQNISAYDVLRYHGVQLKYQGDEHEEQISCPFHGKDTDPSARVYPSTARSQSGVWCFVCNERWDAISLWKKFAGDEDAKFSSVLFGLERAFGLTTPEMPTGLETKQDQQANFEYEEATALLSLCETRLRLAKPKFQMVGFLRVGQALDLLRYRVTNRAIPFESAKQVLRQVLDKIGEKERQS